MRLVSVLLSFLLAIAPIPGLIAEAQAKAIINPFVSFEGEVEGCSPSVVWTDEFGDTDLADVSDTFDIGTADDGRYIAILAKHAGSFNSGSVGGISLREAGTPGSGGSVYVTDAPVTSGTTATVILDHSDNGPFSFGIFAVYCVADGNPTLTGGQMVQDSTLTSNAFSVGVTLPADGVHANHAYCSANTNTFSWTNATEDFDGAIEASAHTHTQAHGSGTGSTTITVQASGTCSSGLLIHASWGTGTGTIMARATCQSSGSNLTQYTFSNFVLPGLSDANDVAIFVGIVGEDDAATFDVSSVTIDGNSASEIVDEGGTGLVNAAFYRSATTLTNAASDVDIVVDFSEAITSAAVCIWGIETLNSVTTDDSIADEDTASGALVLTLDPTDATGHAFGICMADGFTAAATWAVLTERTDTAIGVESKFSNADAAATGSSMAVTCDFSGTGDAAGAAVAAH